MSAPRPPCHPPPSTAKPSTRPVNRGSATVLPRLSVTWDAPMCTCPMCRAFLVGRRAGTVSCARRGCGFPAGVTRGLHVGVLTEGGGRWGVGLPCGVRSRGDERQGDESTATQSIDAACLRFSKMWVTTQQLCLELPMHPRLRGTGILCHRAARQNCCVVLRRGPPSSSNSNLSHHLTRRTCWKQSS